jgi:hypothetical protein
VTETVPRPSETVLLKLAAIATHATALTAPDRPSGSAPVGLGKIQNDRRRAMEKIHLLLADPELRAFLAQLNLKEEESR